MDLATINYKVDTKGLQDGVRALDDFNAANARTVVSLKGVENAARMGGPATKGYTDALAKAYGINDNLTRSQVGVIRSLEDQIAATQLSGKELAQYTALRRAGTAADTEAGRSIANLAAQQYELSQAQDKGTSVAGRWVDTLTRRLVLAYAISQVKDLIRWVVNLNSELAKTGDVGRLTGLGGIGAQQLQTVAGYKGIDTGKFLDDMTGFARQVELAKAGVGDLGSLLRANGVTVKGTEDAFLRVADLVKGSATDIGKFSILQQAGLPATAQMVRLMEQGSEAIKAQMRTASTLTEQQLADARRLDDRWNEMWTNFTRWGKKAIVDLSNSHIVPDSPLDRLLKFLASGDLTRGLTGTKLPNLPGAPVIPVERGPDLPAPKTTVDPAKVIAANQQYIAMVGALGQLATVQQTVLARQKELDNQNLASTTTTDAQKRSIIEMTRAQAEAAQVQVRVANGVATAAELYTTKQRELAISVQNGTLTQEQARMSLAAYGRVIEDTVRQMEVYKSALPGLKQLQLDAGSLRVQLDTLGTSSLNALTTNLADVVMGAKSGSEAFRAFGQTVVRALTEMLIKMTIVQPIAASLQSVLGGFLGGSLGGSLGFASPAARAANGMAFDRGNIIPFARGGVVTRPTIFPFANGTGLMGEAGPEAIMPLKRGPDGRLGVSGGGNNVTVIVENHSGAPVREERTKDANGNDLIRAVIGEVKNDFATGGFDKSMQGRYGVPLRGRAR